MNKKLSTIATAAILLSSILHAQSKIIDSLDLNFNLGLNNRHYQMVEYTLNNENKKVYAIWL